MWDTWVYTHEHTRTYVTISAKAIVACAKTERYKSGNMNKNKLMTVEEVAEQLGVNADTVRRWIRNKELAAIDLGGRAGYRITESDLERFINDRRKTADR